MPATDLPDEIAKLAGEPGAVVVVDREGQIVLMNKGAEELFGIEEGDILGEFVEMLVPEKMRWGHQAYRRGFMAEPNNREMDPGLDPHLERPMDGALVPIAVQLDPHPVNGRLYVAAHINQREEGEEGAA